MGRVETGLVERAMAGDHDAFAGLVDIAGDQLFAIAFRILRDVERAEDAVQQAYLLAWRELPSLRNPERYRPWLHRLLVNACYEESRRWSRWRGRVRALPVEGPSGPDSSIPVAERDSLERAFGKLSPEHRAVFVLHHHVGLPLNDVADAVGVPLGTVKSRLHYATRSLRAALAGDAIDQAEVRPA
jgi:RNA polymerase sigma-70 factor, ECF subfamily